MANPLTFLTRTALASLCAALTVSSFAQTNARLSTETPARLAPSDNAAVLRVLPAGSELRPAPTGTASAPENWQVVNLDGPFTLYVRNGDIDKGLAIKPASPLYLEPDNAAAVVAYAEEGDAITITGLRGRWTQIELDKPLTGYVAATAGNVAATTNIAATETTSVTASSPKSAVVELPADTATEPAPQTALEIFAETETGAPDNAAAIVDSEPTAQTAMLAQLDEPTTAVANAAASAGSERSTREWRAAASTSANPQYSTAPLNRSQIQGKLVSTRRRFGARRPYDWQINAKFSFRIAYLDFSRMQGTDQLARYEGQQVVVYGLVNPLGDGQYVMQVESIRLQ